MRIFIDLSKRSFQRYLTYRRLRNKSIQFEKAIKSEPKERIASYSDEYGGIFHLRTMDYGVDIGFLKGVRLEDAYGLLTGTGKLMRVLPVNE